MATLRPSGKSTENQVVRMLRKAYKLNVDIQRLPDKYDTGNYEDTRPCDHIVSLSRDIALEKFLPNTFYIESKETLATKTSFNIKSTFQKGQLQGMQRAHNLKLPYFIVFQFLKDKENLYLVPSFEILEALQAGKKSISVETIKKYPWTTGELYDYYSQP